MNLPFYVRLESGLLLNLSQLSVIHPRQPNRSIRVQSVGCPALIVISPTTEADEQNIRAAQSVLQAWVVREMGLGSGSTATHDHNQTPPLVTKCIPTVDAPRPAKKTTRKKSTNGRRRRKAAA